MPATKTEHLLTTSGSHFSATESHHSNTSASTLSLSDLQDASTLQLPSEIILAPAASYPSATAATTMAHVRTAIDDLDQQIVGLLGAPPTSGG